MRTLKFIGLGLVSIVVLLLVISFFLPAKVHVERTMIINAKPEAVFNMVNDLKNWNSWSPWNRIDTAMKITYGEISEGKGASYSWTSNHKNVGNGDLKILESMPFESIAVELNFMGQGTALGGYKFEPEGEKTKMTWSMDSDMGMNPIGRFFGLFIDKMVGRDFEKGLKNIDSVLSAMPVIPEIVYTVETTTVTALPCLTILDSADITDMQAIGTKYGEMYYEIGDYMAKNKLKMTGAPFGIMVKTDGEKYIWEGGIPTDKLGKSSGRIVAKNTYSGDVAMVKYFGSYSKTEPAWQAAFKWVAENGKTQNGNPWEVYISDPGTEKDTAKWETDIYIPIK